RGEYSLIFFLETIRNSKHQRIFRADNRQVNLISFGECKQSVDVRLLNRNTSRLTCHPTIARCDIQRVKLITLSYFLHETMLSSPATDDQYVHHTHLRELMFEMSCSGEDHCQSIFVTTINRRLILFRSPRLDNRCNTRFCTGFHCIWHREKSIRSDNGTFRFFTRLFNGYFCCADPVHLTSSDAYCLSVF